MSSRNKSNQLGLDDRSIKLLSEAQSKYMYDPLGFVYWAFPWLVENTSLALEEGPDVWQAEVLTHLGEECYSNFEGAIQIAVASGHGIGKSALVSWIIIWFMFTRPHPQLVVTANTKTQLTTKTWRELAKWHRLSMCRDLFEWQATTFKHRLAPETWSATAIPWSENNPEAFAGTHEKYVLVVFDEASGIVDVIWEVTGGAMSTTGAIWICFGNPTKPTGRFRECFREYKRRWKTWQIDSRTTKKADKKQINNDIEDWGLDSDYVKVRWLGQFPEVGAMQFIGADLVEAARRREIDNDAIAGLPVIMGVDVARHGDDESIIRWRQGPKLWKRRVAMRIQDLMRVASEVAKQIEETNPDLVFIDMVGLGAGVYDRLKQLGFHQVVDVQGGEKAVEETRFRNFRTEMWQRMKEWLSTADIPEGDQDLRQDLQAPEYYFDDKERMYLEKKSDMKQRGEDSPDDGDAVSLMFAHKTPTRPMDEERIVEPEVI